MAAPEYVFTETEIIGVEEAIAAALEREHSPGRVVAELGGLVAAIALRADAVERLREAVRAARLAGLTQEQIEREASR